MISLISELFFVCFVFVGVVVGVVLFGRLGARLEDYRQINKIQFLRLELKLKITMDLIVNVINGKVIKIKNVNLYQKVFIKELNML